MKSVALFYQKHCSPFDRLFYFLLMLTIAFGILLSVINQVFTHFVGVPYANWRFFLVIPLLLGLSALSKLIQYDSPRVYNLVHGYSQYWILIIANTMLLQGIQYTPFPTIDTTLAMIDQWLFFDTPHVLKWVYQHKLDAFLRFFYDALTYELFFLPGIVGFFIPRSRFKRFLLAYLLASIAAEMIYYFLPTRAPASIFTSPYFSEVAQQTHIKFDAVHNSVKYLLPPGTGGLIAFPSLHVIVSIMYIYLCVDKRWMYFIVGTINVIIILATVMLGWHYLVDLIASIIISIACIYISHHWIDHIENKNPT